MPDARYDFGLVRNVKAEALGEPGQRRFRLLLESQGGNACLWLEKNQLFQLSVVILQMLATLSSLESSEGPSYPGVTRADQVQSSMEFDVGNLSVGHDPQKDLFLIEANNRGDDQDREALLWFWASRAQLEALAAEAQAVCAAGRPLCPLCNAPMGPEAHICPKSNGHHSL
jgi:uncharacterized repeat protein (TIGR03847 family)